MDLLYRVRAWAETEADFAALVDSACGAGTDGRELRSLIRTLREEKPAIAQAKLASFQRRRLSRSIAPAGKPPPR
jgi:hypothetical protein